MAFGPKNVILLISKWLERVTDLVLDHHEYESCRFRASKEISQNTSYSRHSILKAEFSRWFQLRREIFCTQVLIIRPQASYAIVLSGFAESHLWYFP